MLTLDGYYNDMYPMVGEMVEKDEGFKKYDTGKLEYNIFPHTVLVDIVKVMMYGAHTKGYGVDNWKKCTDSTRYYNALCRHMEAVRAGEYTDVESGLPHLSHALCNLVFWHYLEEGKRNARQTEISKTRTVHSGADDNIHYDSTEGISPQVQNTFIHRNAACLP